MPPLFTIGSIVRGGMWACLPTTLSSFIPVGSDPLIAPPFAGWVYIPRRYEGIPPCARVLWLEKAQKGRRKCLCSSGVPSVI